MARLCTGSQNLRRIQRNRCIHRRHNTWARILVSTGVRRVREASGSPELPHQRDLK